jgi:hypothetical protein
MEESSPMMDHGSMFDGVWGPPASKPVGINPDDVYALAEASQEEAYARIFFIYLFSESFQAYTQNKRMQSTSQTVHTKKKHTVQVKNN